MLKAESKKAARKAIAEAKTMPGATGDIVKWLEAGWREAEIAGFCGLSVETVNAITSGMFYRLEVKGVHGFYANGIR